MSLSRMLRISRWRERASRGQALVETALVAVFLLLLLSVAVDLGRAFFTVVALQNAVGEGALYGSAFPNRWAATGPRYRFADPNNITYRVKNESVNSRWLNASEVTVSIQFLDGSGSPVSTGNAGMPIVVTATYPFDLIGPLPGLLGFQNSLTLRASARQVMLIRP